MTAEELERLLARYALGDRVAFSALYDRTSAKLFGVCLRILKDRGAAQDILQDVYVRIWQAAGRARAAGCSPMGWMVALARNAAIDRLRQRRETEVEIDKAIAIADPAPGPGAATVAADIRRRIDDCLGELDPGKADAVRGAYLDGLTYEELATRHGVPLDMMRTGLRRSLLALRACMGGSTGGAPVMERDGDPLREEGYLAAELALDLLEGEARAAAVARASYDPGFAAQVADWRQRLTQLDYEFAEVPAPPSVKHAVEAGLLSDREEERASRPHRLWRSVALWRGIALASLPAALLLAIAPSAPDRPQARLVTALYAPDGSLGVVGIYDADAAVLRLNRLAGAAAPGRELELWLAPDVGAALVSLGLITDAVRVDVPLPGDLSQRVGPEGYFAISDEPPGGSPTGAPTGAVLAVGPIAPI